MLFCEQLETTAEQAKEKTILERKKDILSRIMAHITKL